ncbi:MAG: sugar ABC transporter permease [Actinobacteria bacterium HGW-Actinobacteria-2]|nr:MAG: sugar ABC transporter permease [Actinobacteria bacterium HGW-Actinobacteria-2]
MADTKTAVPDVAAPPAEKGLKAILGGNIRQYGMMFALFLLMAFFTIQTSGLFLTPRNITLLLVQNSYVLILAIGMVMVIIAGHIDLSVGSVCAFVGAVVALSMKSWGFPWWAAILLGIVMGVLVGMWQGFWVAIVGIPAFIVTLAGMLLFRGLDLMILNAESITVPEQFQAIANGYLPAVGPNTNYHNLTLLFTVLAVAAVVWMEIGRRNALRKHSMTMPPVAQSVIKVVLLGTIIIVAGLLLASYRGVPVVALILFALVGIYSFVTRRTVFGRHIYAVGGNRNAARLTGVNTTMVDFLLMVNMSMLAGVAGMVYTAYLNAANPKDGTGFELDAIAAVFIGGAAVAGGIGTVVGSIVGGLVMGVLNLGLANMSVDQNVIQVIKGLVLLGAVAFDVVSKKQGKPSVIGLIQRTFSRSAPLPGAEAEAAVEQPGGAGLGKADELR